MAEQVPSIGRAVHYVTTSGAHVPADICAVQKSGALDLFIKDSGLHKAFFGYGVTADPKGKTPSTWHWPEYIPAKE